MSIIGVVIALLLTAYGAYVIVSAIPEPAVSSTPTTASVTLPRPLINRPHYMLSEPNARTADREQLRRYFLQGRPDGLGQVSP